MLLIGAAGSGKAALAWTVHSQSLRRHEPFLMIPCGDLTGNGFETAFANFARGAAAGVNHAGTTVVTQPGTVFLNDIDALDPNWQAALLGYVEGPRESTEGARLIGGCATDLAHAVELGRFRQDLFYRLSVMTLHLPPVTARPRASRSKPLRSLDSGQ